MSDTTQALYDHSTNDSAIQPPRNGRLIPDRVLLRDAAAGGASWWVRPFQAAT